VGQPQPAFAPLDAGEVAAFEARLHAARTGAVALPAALAGRARALLEAATPRSVAPEAAGAVIDRWLASLSPLEPVLVRAPEPKRKPTAAKPAKSTTMKAGPALARPAKAKPAKAKPVKARPAKAKSAKAKPPTKKSEPRSRSSKSGSRSMKPRR
jgi:hypothetical protein